MGERQPEVGGQRDGARHESGRHAQAEHPSEEALPVALVAGGQGQDEGGDPDRQGGDDRELAGQERVGDRHGRHDDGDERGVDGLGQEQGGDALGVGHDTPPLSHDPGKGRELSLEQHQARHRLGGRRSVAHGDAEVGVLERQGVVDAVPGHGDDVPSGLQCPHQCPFLLGSDASQDTGTLNRVGQALQVLLRLLPAARSGRQGTCVQNDELAAVGRGDSGLAGDRGHGLGAVPGDDLGVDALPAEVGQGLRGVGANLLGEDHDPCGLKVVGKPRLLLPRGQPPGRARAGQGHDAHPPRGDLTGTIQH